MMMMNSTLDEVHNLAELESLNQDFLLSFSSNEGFSDHLLQRPQIPFSFTNDAASVNPYNNSSFHVQEPALNFDYSLGNFLPQEGGFASRGCNSGIIPSSESDCLANSPSEFLLTDEVSGSTYNYGGKKRKRSNDRAKEKPKEVVHVRAKRGQATDSHSLAERHRRVKIKEKLKCLQDIVPGCYKTMGMAVMLDVIINYVRSLQNQIDFLSMKLSTASLYYDFNSSDMDAMGTMQAMHGFEGQGMERMMGEGYGGLPQFQTTWPL